MNEATAPSPILEISNLNVAYRGASGWVPVVRGINLDVDRGRSLVLLGESGSGKSVTLRAVVGLLQQEGARVEGQVKVGGDNVTAMTRERTLAAARQARRLHLPGADDRHSTRSSVSATRSPRRSSGIAARPGNRRWRAAKDLFDLVQIPSAERRLQAYPNELSGGLRQRAMIAMAMSCEPRTAAGGRADDGARRHGADPDPAAVAPDPEGARNGDGVRHPRPRRRR